MVTQIRQTKSASAYAAEINCYATQTGYNDTALMSIFEKSLKTELRKELVRILNGTTTGKFDSLRELKKETIDTNQQFWELNANLNRYCRNPAYGNYILAKNHELLNKMIW